MIPLLSAVSGVREKKYSAVWNPMIAIFVRFSALGMRSRDSRMVRMARGEARVDQEHVYEWLGRPDEVLCGRGKVD